MMGMNFDAERQATIISDLKKVGCKMDDLIEEAYRVSKELDDDEKAQQDALKTFLVNDCKLSRAFDAKKMAIALLQKVADTVCAIRAPPCAICVPPVCNPPPLPPRV